MFLCSCQSSHERAATKSLTNNHETRISVNQVGYYPDWDKVAYISNYQQENIVKLVDTISNQVVARLKIEKVHNINKALPDRAKIDFSQVRTPGKYVLVYQEVRSPTFTIERTLYRPVITTLLRSYYLQRCGEALDDTLSKIHHSVCHINDSQLFRPLKGIVISQIESDKSTTEVDTRGGWHDAGDFGKYVSTTTVSIGRILAAYTLSNNWMAKLNLSIGAHEDSSPDVLTEMQYGLNWLLKMQTDSGAVFRKVAGKKWPALGAPNKDNQQRFVYGVATDDTAKFSATMALASRIYQKYDTELSERYIEAAELSWRYLETNPHFLMDWKKEDDSGSGPYKANATDKEMSLNYDTDDRLWAAAELYIKTNKNKYLVYINQNIGLPLNLYEWKDPSALGKWHIFSHLCEPHTIGFCEQLREQFITRANQAFSRVQQADFSLANQNFIWGSNKMAVEEAMFLLIAYQLTKERKYAQAAIFQADYIFGNNPFSLSFVSGIGENPVKNVSHIFSRGENIYIPGLLVGGPNRLAQASIAPKDMGILSYTDNEKSYAVNEYAIDYNASLIGLLSELARLHIKE